jgi:hypothetical protein
MEWTEIKTQADVDALMEVYGNFHDSCIREAHLSTDHWVSSNLYMRVGVGPDMRIRFLIQRQFKDPSAIELLFEDVVRFNFVSAPENCDSIISDAALSVQGGNIYWSPEGNWNPEKPSRDEFTWIAAKRLRWRGVDWLGSELRYGPREEDE